MPTASAALSSQSRQENDPCKSTTSLDIIKEAYPGQAVLNVEQTARVMGKTGKGGTQTIRNQISAGRFPLQGSLRRSGSTILVPIVALANWLDGVVEDGVVPTVPAGGTRKKSSPLPAKPPILPRRGRGRPPMIVKDFLRLFETAWQTMLLEGALVEKRVIDADLTDNGVTIPPLIA